MGRQADKCDGPGGGPLGRSPGSGKVSLESIESWRDITVEAEVTGILGTPDWVRMRLGGFCVGGGGGGWKTGLG